MAAVAPLAAPPPPSADARRITEADPDFARLRDATARRLSASVRRLVRDLRERPAAEHPAIQSAFIQRHIALLRDAYAAGHAEGARDYYEAVSLQPARWARALAPTVDERKLRERLGFYAPSVAKLAHEARLAWQASQRQQAARRAERALGLAEGQRHDKYPPDGVADCSGAYASIRLAAGDTDTPEDADPLDAWVVGVQGRIGLQAEIAWPGLMDGYVRAGVMDPAAPFSLVWWVLGAVETRHCTDCPRYAADSPYNAPGSGGNELKATPGDGTTECGAGCKCTLEYVPGGAIEHTVWSVLVPQIEERLAGAAASPWSVVPEADLTRDADGNVTGWVVRDAAGNVVARMAGNPADLAREEGAGQRTPPGDEARRASAWGQIADTLARLRSADIQPPKSNVLADAEKAALDRYRSARERWERVRAALPELPPLFADATGLPLEDAGALRSLLPGTFEALTAEQQAALGDLWDALLAWDEASGGDGDVASDPWAEPGMFSDGEHGRQLADSPAGHAGVMVAFMLRPEEARALALPGGEPPDELHLTLAYLGDKHTLSAEQLRALRREVASFAPEATPLAGAVSGLARFNPGPGSDGKAPCVALVNVPGLQAWRAALVRRLTTAGLPVAADFEYTPHITLAYVGADEQLPVTAVPAVPLALDHLSLAIGDWRTTMPVGDEQYPSLADRDGGMTFTGGHEPGYEQNRTRDGRWAVGDGGQHAHTGHSGQREHEVTTRGSRGLSGRASAGHHAGSGSGGGGAPLGTGYAVTRSTHADASSAALFGRVLSDAEMAKLAGALPGTSVRVLAGAEHDSLTFHVTAGDGSYYATRGVIRAPNGHLYMGNHSLEVADGQRGHGLGLRILATQVKAASSLGVRYITTEAARDDRRGVTGYKAWPGMGYNAHIPAGLRPRLPAHLRGARTILDLYASADGHAWWAEHGTLTRMYFDLKPGSRSRQRLAERLKQRGIAWDDL